MYPQRHLDYYLFTDCSVCDKIRFLYIQFPGFNFVRIGDDAPLEITGTARNAGDQVRDIPAGADFCGLKGGPPVGLHFSDDLLEQIFFLPIDIVRNDRV